MVNKKRTLWAIDLNGSPLNQFSGNEFEIYEDFEGKVNLAIDGRILNASTIDEWNEGGGGGSAKRVELMDDIDLDDEWYTLDLEGLGIPDFSMTDLDEGKVKFTFNSMDLEFIGRGSRLSNEYYWLPTPEGQVDEYAVFQLFNKTTLSTITIVLAFGDTVVEACGHDETDYNAQADLTITINPLNTQDVVIDTNTGCLTDNVESVEELYHQIVHYREKFITFAWTNIINESSTFKKGMVEGISYDRNSNQLNIEVSCDNYLFSIFVWADGGTGDLVYNYYCSEFVPDYHLYLNLDLNDDEFLAFSDLNNILQYMWDIEETELVFGQVGYYIENGENAPILSSSGADLRVVIDYDQHTITLILGTSRGEIIIDVVSQQEGDYTFQVNWDGFEKPGSSPNSSIPTALYVDSNSRKAIPVVKYILKDEEYSAEELYSLFQEIYASDEDLDQDNTELNLPLFFIKNVGQPLSCHILDKVNNYVNMVEVSEVISDYTPEDPITMPTIIYEDPYGYTGNEYYLKITSWGSYENHNIKGLVIHFWWEGE